ncbi:hypothetical protein HanRHA438_Chr13g0604701 [Helianthus annuus]|uniref:Uncharacterized protein n=1 Tax=Helianthus annuus TaxID=4232 RepID=A0A9K3EJ83_HELAN|nr:hypothetical protein HanXRQr2_Chr13g0594011 [Helianthus annuus]KAJ0477331.1 hypothetical protein HanHA300_Chr13g0487261 [Helianthus annuus]KAJ0481757.1 hypothetical protein HanIR_Chr13g0646251 [Helianthus annuus]KAJ0498166.1 hypothetical protein HanHA89_Chr13g0519431 [Helianthus annuus]KAJ0664167.1 hypothetical protein HanLR1_Chr13g0489271 [Helianthus annuus]
MFGSLIAGLNNCLITHALRTEPLICNNCVNTFWNTAKVNRRGTNGAGAIEAMVQKKEVIVTDVVIHEVLKFRDQPHFPTSFEQSRVLAALRRMSYERSYPTVLKKLFLPYWRLLVHIFLQCIAENMGGYDQLNKTQTCALVALVNEWDYKFSAFIFDNMKKMLEHSKKTIFMLYPRFIQMILDQKHPEFIKGPNYVNLKPLGPSCFENAYRFKRAKQHNFIGKFPLEKHGRFSDVVPVVPVVPTPQPMNAQIAEEHDVQQVQ